MNSALYASQSISWTYHSDPSNIQKVDKLSHWRAMKTGPHMSEDPELPKYK